MHHRVKFNFPDDVVPEICAPLS